MIRRKNAWNGDGAGAATSVEGSADDATLTSSFADCVLDFVVSGSTRLGAMLSEGVNLSGDGRLGGDGGLGAPGLFVAPPEFFGGAGVPLGLLISLLEVKRRNGLPTTWHLRSVSSGQFRLSQGEASI